MTDARRIVGFDRDIHALKNGLGEVSALTGTRPTAHFRMAHENGATDRFFGNLSIISGVIKNDQRAA
jgi:hypothetical protein